MRLNKYIAGATGLSRRAADTAIADNRVLVNGLAPSSGQQIADSDAVSLDGAIITLAAQKTTVMINKPAGYVVSRNGQGSKTIYDLLPPALHALKPIGRLDKDSSGLLLLTDDGDLANELTHPSHQKVKIYEIAVDKPLQPLHRQMIHDHGINLEDGNSQLQLERLKDGDDLHWKVMMYQGRNRQIRRTFAALGYKVVELERTQFGPYQLTYLAPTQSYKQL
jgi:23S rRNA pseudouridine2605 synthase